jgi:hypothetical protein
MKTEQEALFELNTTIMEIIARRVPEHVIHEASRAVKSLSPAELERMVTEWRRVSDGPEMELFPLPPVSPQRDWLPPSVSS